MSLACPRCVSISPVLSFPCPKNVHVLPLFCLEFVLESERNPLDVLDMNFFVHKALGRTLKGLLKGYR